MKQLTLDQARQPTGRGGRRPGAGRPKRPGSVSHRPRPSFPGRYPQHVTLRLGASSPSIAREWLFARAIRPAIAASEKPSFRVIDFNVLSNHVHLIVEADGADALSRGVQGRSRVGAPSVRRRCCRGARVRHRESARARATDSGHTGSPSRSDSLAGVVTSDEAATRAARPGQVLPAAAEAGGELSCR
jgi:REP element-mobilizing transposase RayT